MEPITIDDVESQDWDESADVVVIGYGGAGASAAPAGVAHTVTPRRIRPAAIRAVPRIN